MRPYAAQALRYISMFSLCLNGAFIVLIFFTEPGEMALISLEYCYCVNQITTKGDIKKKRHFRVKEKLY